MEDVYRTFFEKKIESFLKNNPDLKIERRVLEKFCQECYDDFHCTILYFDKAPHWTGPKKEDLKIMVPRSMIHLFDGWLCRIMRIRKTNDLYKEK